jgi:hypothetical protein
MSSSKAAFIVPDKTEEPVIAVDDEVDMAEFNRMKTILLKRAREQKNKEYFDKHPELKNLKDKIAVKEVKVVKEPVKEPAKEPAKVKEEVAVDKVKVIQSLVEDPQTSKFKKSKPIDIPIPKSDVRKFNVNPVILGVINNANGKWF